MCCDFLIVILLGNQTGEQIAGLVFIFYTHFYFLGGGGVDSNHGTLSLMVVSFHVLRSHDV